MIKAVRHPIAFDCLAKLRREGSRGERENLTRSISLCLACEVFSDLKLVEQQSEGETSDIKAVNIAEQIALIAVLPGGATMLEAFSDFAGCGKIGYALKRKDDYQKSEDVFLTIPDFPFDSRVVVLDRFLTDGVLHASLLSKLQFEGYSSITLVTILAAPEGAEKIRSEFPDVSILTASLEKGLSPNGKLIPGFPGE